MGQKYEASLAFLVGNGGSLLDLASLTLHYKSIKQTQIQFTFQPKSNKQFFTHKVMESKSCNSMQRFGSIARMVSTRLLNFVRSNLVIYQDGKVICKWVLSKIIFKSIHNFMW